MTPEIDRLNRRLNELCKEATALEALDERRGLQSWEVNTLHGLYQAIHFHKRSIQSLVNN